MKRVLIPGDRLDPVIMRRTLAATQQHRDLVLTWGRDYPMLPMSAEPGFPRQGWKLQVEGIDPLS